MSLRSRPNRTRRTARLLTSLAAIGTLLVTTGCGGDDASGDGTVTGGEPTDTTVVDLDLEPVDGDDGGDGGVPGDGDGDADAPEKPDVEVPGDVPTELVVTDLVTGVGPAARAGDTVVVDYVGVVTGTGVEFDNSYDRQMPFNVRLGDGRVIAGWDEGLIGVQAGGRRQLDIPADLAYGDNPPGGSAISAGDALTFVVDVRAVVPSVSVDDEPDTASIATSVGRTDLGILDVVEGEGEPLEMGDTAIAHLMLLRGNDLEVLESTWRFDQPAEILLVAGGAIDGLVDGLVGMRVGGLRVISMPPALAFGPEGIPDAGLPGDVDVIVVAELIGRY